MKLACELAQFHFVLGLDKQANIWLPPKVFEPKPETGLYRSGPVKSHPGFGFFDAHVPGSKAQRPQPENTET